MHDYINCKCMNVKMEKEKIIQSDDVTPLTAIIMCGSTHG